MQKHVMIVDDDPAVLETVNWQLTRGGYTVIKAHGAQACLEEVRRGFHGVILMDIAMPGMDGWDTIRILSNEGLLQGNLVCMMTGQTDPGGKSQGLEALVIDYLTKPFQIDQLLAVVGNAFEFLP
jgi:DNA-binding response OmpR family regulator